jgi:WD40 repeat protein
MWCKLMGIPAGLDPKQAHVVAQWPVGGPMVCCRFDPAGRFVFCGLEGPTIERVALADGKRVSFAGGHDSWVFALACSPDGRTVYSGGGDGRVVAWPGDSAGPKPLRAIDAHRGWVRALGVSRDGRIVASGGNDRVIRLWDAASGRLVRELVGHRNHVYSLEIHPDGQTVVSGDLLGSIRQWDLATGKLVDTFDAGPLHTFEGGQMVDFGGVRGLAFSPDGNALAAGGLHKASNPLGAVHEPIALVFDVKTRKSTRTLVADGIAGGVIWRLRHLADGSLMAACGGTSGGFLLFWKLGSDKAEPKFALPGSARDMDLHTDGLRVATAHHDGILRITRLALGQ